MNQLTDQHLSEIRAPHDSANDAIGQAGVDVWGIVNRRKWILIFGMIVGLGLGYIYLLQADPVYESQSQVLIETDRVMPMGLEFSGMDYGQGANHEFILRSPKIIIQAYDQQNLKKLSTFAEADEAITLLSENLTVTPVDDKATIFTVSFRGPDPDDATEVVDAVLLSYHDFLKENFTTDSGKTRKLFIETRDDLNEKIEKLESDYLTFQQTAPDGFRFGLQQTSVSEQHQQYHNQRIVELRQEIAKIAAESEAMQLAVQKNIAPEALLLAAGLQDRNRLADSAALRRDSLYQNRLLPLLFAYEELSTRYGEDYPAVRSTKKQIDVFRKQFPEFQSDAPPVSTDDLNDQVAAYITSLGQKRIALEAELNAIEGFFLAKDAETRKLAAFKAKDKKFLDEIARQTSRYDTIITMLTQIGMVSNDGFDGFKFSRIGEPTPGLKVAPSALKVIPISAILGIMAGFGLGYLMDVSDKAFRTPDEVGRIMRLPLIGHIPLIDVQKVKTLPGSLVDPVVVTLHKPKSPQSEAYRAIRTALYFNSRDEHHRIIQITSPMPGDGKSTLAVNLAITIAQSGKSVLLMDADFRRPTLHKVLGLEKQKHGLATVVAGESEPDDCAVTFAEIPNLSFLPCGSKPSNPSELLSSQQFADSLEMYRQKYDFLIVDTPPLLAVSDPCAVAARTDGVILTFRIHKRARPLAVRARDALQDIGANVIGVVVNGVDQEAGGYYSQYRYGFSGYRYAYNYRYGYGYGAYGTYGTEKSEAKAIGKYFDEEKSPEKLHEKELGSEEEELGTKRN